MDKDTQKVDKIRYIYTENLILTGGGAMERFIKTIRLILESFVFAFTSVIVNRLRTVLSLLGITIGIFAIISVFTIFDSLEINIRESLSQAGENVIYIQK